MSDGSTAVLHLFFPTADTATSRSTDLLLSDKLRKGSIKCITAPWILFCFNQGYALSLRFVGCIWAFHAVLKELLFPSPSYTSWYENYVCGVDTGHFLPIMISNIFTSGEVFCHKYSLRFICMKSDVIILFPPFLCGLPTLLLLVQSTWKENLPYRRSLLQTSLLATTFDLCFSVAWALGLK